MKASAIVFRVFGFVLLILTPTITQAQNLRVTLLGTGGPAPRIERFGPSVLVEAGSEKFLFDCGRGATQRLFQLNIPFAEVSALYLTHLHSDHVVGIPDLWLTGWFRGRQVPLRIWGPVGTQEMMSYLEKAYQFDTQVRRGLPETLPERGVAIITKDITEGVVYEKNGVKISAFNVDHGSVKPAFGYRVDYAGRSVVLSGDTRYSENLIHFSKGTDLLIHDAVVVEQELLRTSEAARAAIELLATPEQAGEVFDRVKPKLAVYSHYNTAKDLVVRTRKTYSGPLEVGEDLMVIEVGEKIDVRRDKK